MTIRTAAQSTISIGTTTAASTLQEYEADTYVEIGEVEDLGEFGDQANEVTFTAVGDARVRRLKGSRDAGTISLVVARDADDTGQQALKDALGTDSEYSLKIEGNDAPAGGTPSTFYMRVLVMSAKNNYGSVDNVVRTTYALAINSEILEVEPAAAP